LKVDVALLPRSSATSTDEIPAVCRRNIGEFEETPSRTRPRIALALRPTDRPLAPTDATNLGALQASRVSDDYELGSAARFGDI